MFVLLVDLRRIITTCKKNCETLNIPRCKCPPERIYKTEQPLHQSAILQGFELQKSLHANSRVQKQGWYGLSGGKEDGIVSTYFV